MKLLRLSNGSEVMVDDDDFERLGHFKWSAQGSLGYAVREQNRTRLHLHREIFGEIPPGMFVDHINRNVRDNRKDNLRLATPAQSSRNMGKRRKGKFKGVTYNPRAHKSRPWQARVTVDGRVFCRYYTTEEEAAKGYDALAQEHHGEFACLNFP
jgi:hypothetical protein